MVLGQIKTGIVALLLWLRHIGIFLESPSGIRTDKDWKSGSITMAGTLRDILRISQ